MELIQPNLYFIECRDEQDIHRISIVDQSSLHVLIGDSSRDDQGIIMWEMQVSQVVVCEGYGLEGIDCWREEIINFFFSSPIRASGMSFLGRA